MNRREFVYGIGLSASMSWAQEGPPLKDPVEKQVADREPAIQLCHAGFRPDSGKRVVFRLAAQGGQVPQTFVLYDISSGPTFRTERPLHKTQSDFGDCLVGDFSDVTRLGMYQVQIGDERSIPFFIRPDAWRRTLPKAVGYHKYQRCGVAVPGVHPVCHLDDARRRDNGQHVDVTGGWHDAGDLRKWMDATMMNGFGLLHVARSLGESWDPAGSGLAPVREEVRWGNRYFLKMQDTDGRVWADTAGGINGDNSDNHWTDNRPGTADDRYIDTTKHALVQAMFTALEAMVAQAFSEVDAAYAESCLKAGVRCWEANLRQGNTRELGWWLMAALELHRSTGKELYAREAVQLANRILDLQVKEFIADQKLIRGFWRTSGLDASPYANAVDSALPALVLLYAARAYPDNKQAPRWREAVLLYIEEYVLLMCARSAYGIMPFGLFLGSPTPERYRSLGGQLTYRYFMPVRKQFWWQGLNAHLECCALLLAMAARDFRRPTYRDLAYRQLEWVMGANPFGATLMTGEGARNPYPHSRYVGLIPGGIMNGICGNQDDEPVLDTGYGFNWRTNEYWSPHVAYYEWVQSVLEKTD